MGTWLIFSILLPVLGAVAIQVVAPRNRAVARWIALASSLAVMLLVGWVICAAVAPDSPTDGRGAFVDTLVSYRWFDAVSESSEDLTIDFSTGLDGLSLWLYGLTGLLVITSVLVSWEAIKEGAPAFYSLLLLLETGMLGVFAARDLILFYVFFEATLIPLFFLVGIWGGEHRRWAAIKFFIFTLTGSLLTFLGLLSIVLVNWQASGRLTFAIAELQPPDDWALQWAIFLALFAGFAIKVPLFPLHTWLPLAHVEAPTAGSILLAGVLLKIGTYGFARFSIPLLPEAAADLMPWLIALSVAGIIYGALVALAQTDIKRLIAYSSVSHLGFCMLGLFALNHLGLQGSVLQMIAHGLSTGGLFAVVGMLYERFHTREIAAYGGLATKYPRLATFALLLTFASVGLPGMAGFAGEFPALLGAFQRAWAWTAAVEMTVMQICTVAAVSGVVLGAWYMLSLMRRLLFGSLREPHVGHDHESPRDLNFREVCALAPLVLASIWIGLWPNFFSSRVEATALPLLAPVEATLDRRASVVAGSQPVTRTAASEVARVD